MGSGYRKVFYYDAVPGQEYGETIPAYERRVQPEHERFDRIKEMPYFHVVLGELKGQKPRRQKRVDVSLAVDMLTHTFRKNMDHAVLFARDDDFTPLVQALVREGMNVTVWHPDRAAKGLLNAADVRKDFSLRNSYPYLLRDGKRAFTILNHAHNVQNTFPDARLVSNQAGEDFLIRWDNDALIVMRPSAALASYTTSTLWELISLSAHSCTEAVARRAFTALFGWDISTLEVS